MKLTAKERYELLKAMIQREYSFKDHAVHDPDHFAITILGEKYTVSITATDDFYDMYTDHRDNVETIKTNERTVKNPQTAFNYAERFYMGMTADQYKDFVRYRRVREYI